MIPLRRPALATSVGAVAGLAWGCGLRVWMAALAGDASHVTAATVYGILLPAAATGALLGRAAARRAAGRPVSRWVVASPLLLSSIVATPSSFVTLVTTGIGGGALAVPLFAIMGGYSLRGNGSRWWRGLSGAVSMAGIVGVGLAPRGINPDLQLTDLRGLLYAALGVALVGALTWAAGTPYPLQGTATASRRRVRRMSTSRRG